MQPLTSSQAKYLRGLAHGLKPVVFVGQKGITASLLDSIQEALNAHELIKAKFIDFKDRRMKATLAAEIEQQTGSRVAGLIGHTAILYRPHPDPEKRKIVAPVKGGVRQRRPHRIPSQGVELPAGSAFTWRISRIPG